MTIKRKSVRLTMMKRKGAPMADEADKNYHSTDDKKLRGNVNA